jgi:hypothetical protein
MGRSINLDTPLLKLSANDRLSVRDSFQNIFACGVPGSGKTTGSGAHIARAFLRAGMGGLVMVAKPEEAEHWFSMCHREGRSASFINFNERTPGFNFLAYELARLGTSGLNSVIECLMRVIEIANSVGAAAGRPGEAFWEDTKKQVLRSTIPALYAATGTVTIADILQFIRTAPTSQEQMRDPKWQRRSFFFSTFLKASERLPDDEGERIISYWENDWATLDVKTRGNIAISLTTALDRFNHGWLKEAFCGQTTVVPELSFHGAIIVMNMPALTLNEDGIIAQQLFKYMWQRSVLTRNSLPKSEAERPIFCWSDEAQYFVNSYDAEFLSTCRGSRVSTVFLTQSLPSFYARMGGDNARDRVHHLLGNFATRIFHASGCAETNEWASRTIGKIVRQRHNYNHSEGSNQNFGMNMGAGENWGSNSGSGSSFSYNGGGNGQGGSYSVGSNSNSGSSSGGSDNHGRNRGTGTNEGESWGWSQQVENLIEPGDFGRILKTGGPANGNIVSAIWYQAGRVWDASKGNALLVEFRQ